MSIAQNQVTSPGTEAQRAIVGALIESHPYWTDIWNTTEITGWINGTLMSKNLNNLYNLYFMGHIQEVWNLIWSEGSHNTLNPLWVDWGDA